MKMLTTVAAVALTQNITAHIIIRTAPIYNGHAKNDLKSPLYLNAFFPYLLSGITHISIIELE
jgi:hypothetical protein